jgi:hypothetical protein
MGSDIAQAVSCRLPTAAVRVRDWVRSCGICGGQSDTEAGFLRIARFPLPIRIPPIAPQSSSSIIRGWYNRPNSGLSTKWTQSHLMRKENLNNVWEDCYIDTKSLNLIELELTFLYRRKVFGKVCL